MTIRKIFLHAETLWVLENELRRKETNWLHLSDFLTVIIVTTACYNHSLPPLLSRLQGMQVIIFVRDLVMLAHRLSLSVMLSVIFSLSLITVSTRSDSVLSAAEQRRLKRFSSSFPCERNLFALDSRKGDTTDYNVLLSNFTISLSRKHLSCNNSMPCRQRCFNLVKRVAV